MPSYGIGLRQEQTQEAMTRFGSSVLLAPLR
jgi:hypothetical protein